MLGKKLTPILIEIENTIIDFDVLISKKPNYDDEALRAATKIFMSVFMDKIWDLQQSEKMAMPDREHMAENAGKDFRKLIKTYTGIDSHEFYNPKLEKMATEVNEPLDVEAFKIKIKTLESALEKSQMDFEKGKEQYKELINQFKKRMDIIKMMFEIIEDSETHRLKKMYARTAIKICEKMEHDSRADYLIAFFGFRESSSDVLPF